MQATTQSAGRGRRGRSWTSAPGNLFCTYLTWPDVPLARASAYGFIAANAVAETIETYLPGEDIKIKWPNDVQVGGAKISGILLESGQIEGRLWLAVGIGINLISAPSDVAYPVTNIGAHIKSDDPEDIPNPMGALAVLADNFEKAELGFKSAGFGPVREQWLARAAGLGKTVSATAPEGKIIGTLKGLTMDGELQVQLPDGRDTLISSGEVFLGSP